MRFSLLRSVLVIATLASAMLVSCSCANILASPAEEPPVLAVTETQLCVFGANRTPAYVDISPDGKRTAYTVMRPDNWFVAMIDGVEGKKYDEIKEYAVSGARCTYIFSPDSKHVAYLARTYRSWMVVLDGVESAPYDKIYKMEFSPDSQHFAFDAKKGDKEVIVLDGVESKPFDCPDRPRDPNRQLLPDEGMFDRPYVGVGFTFSPDSKHLAYCVNDKDGGVVMLDGKAFYAVKNDADYHYARVDMPVFSPDSTRIAFYSLGKGYFFVIENLGKDKPERVLYGMGSSPMGDVVFSPDSKHFAYVDQDPATRQSFVVRDGFAGKKYDWVDPQSLLFSANSARLAYIVKVKYGEGQRSLAVLDGRECENPANNPACLTFSPDSKHFAYIFVEKEGMCVVVDGQKRKEYKSIAPRIVFSPDSQHLAYEINIGYTARAVLDENEGPLFNTINEASFTFSPDSKHLAYLGDMYRGERLTPCLALDGAVTPKTCEVIVTSRIVFTAPDKCRVFTWRNAGVAALEATAP